MNVTILCVGKIKEKFYSDAISEYYKRLQRYCKLEIIEVADEKTPDHANQKQVEQILKKEAERLLSRMKYAAFTITLEIPGKKMDSISFSNLLNHAAVEGKGNIQFIIGGSLGLHSSISERADLKLSFSDMTFPHQLMRVILLEQIYRGFRISQNEPYHK